MKKLVIGVTALNAIDSPGPGVAVIRAIRECKDFEVRIIGLAYEAMEPGLYMHDLVDKTYQIPYPSGGTEPLLARLEYSPVQVCPLPSRLPPQRFQRELTLLTPFENPV